MSKIVVSILAYNAKPFIKYCLDSIYDFADRIVIVEGTYGIQRAFGKRSTDRTLDIINNYPDPNNKITLLFKNGKEHEHRNEVLKHCEPGDWFFTVHTDEIYKKEDLKKLKTILMQDKSTDLFWVICYTFYYNFSLYLEEIYQRLYRVRQGCYFIHKDTMVTKEGVNFMKLKCKTLDINDIILYHYGYITGIAEKLRYYGKGGKQWYKEIFTRYRPENAEEIYERNRILNGKKGIHMLGGGILQTFKGQHPEVMADCPLKSRDLIEEYKKGHIEPLDQKLNIFDRALTGLRYLYYIRQGN